MIKRIELQGEYLVTVKNDPDKEKTTMGVDNFSLIFTTKQDVIKHINELTKALEFWKYDSPEVTNDG